MLCQHLFYVSMKNKVTSPHIKFDQCIFFCYLDSIRNTCRLYFRNKKPPASFCSLAGRFKHHHGKACFFICESKGADQLRSNSTADQCLCFRYIDSTIPLLRKSEISSLWPSSVAVQPSLCRTWSETLKTVFFPMQLSKSLLVREILKAGFLSYLSRVMRKPTFWFPTWSDTNQAVQLLKTVRGLKFRKGLYYPCSENKGADQLRDYREADLRLCFRIFKMLFLVTRLISLSFHPQLQMKSCQRKFFAVR